MTTGEMIEKLLELSYIKYKKLSKGCIEGRKLDRKETVTIEGIDFSCWHEYVCYRVCRYIKEKVPDAVVQLEIAGNNSTVSVELNDGDEKKLNSKMFNLIKEWKE